MPERAPTFSNADHKKLDVYLLKLMEAVRDGQLKPDIAAAEVAHLLAAVDLGNYAEPLGRAARPDESVAYFVNYPA